MSELIKADNEYKEWIAGISTDFRKSQIRASMKINDEMLRFGMDLILFLNDSWQVLVRLKI